jgi:hypothetical protein
MSRYDCGVPIGRAYRLRMLIFPLAAALAVLSQTSLSDAWHSCRCGNARADNQSSGGDGNLLLWKSSQRVEHPSRGAGEADVRCYEQEVRNASSLPVTDVAWEAANFFKSLIPGGRAACDALGVQDLAKQYSGPITYGPSRDPRYTTQVWGPAGGWGKAGARLYGDVPVLAFTPRPQRAHAGERHRGSADSLSGR